MLELDNVLFVFFHFVGLIYCLGIYLMEERGYMVPWKRLMWYHLRGIEMLVIRHVLLDLLDEHVYGIFVFKLCNKFQRYEMVLEPKKTRGRLITLLLLL